jgi:acetyltransferase-like isoleucine patch superfamily enzyme
MDKTNRGIRISTLSDQQESAWVTYSKLVVGSRSLWLCLRYELLMGLCSSTGGALGIAIRRFAYRRLFKSVERGLVIGKNVTIRGGRGISIGKNVIIDDNCVLDARGPDASIEIGDGAIISRNSVIRSRNAKLSIGAGCDIGCNCILATDSQLLVGKHVLLGAYSYLCAGGLHRFDGTEPCIIKQGMHEGTGVTIGDGAWIGTRVSVLDGASVGTGAVVGAHALVTRSIPDMSVAFGTPAIVTRKR